MNKEIGNVAGVSIVVSPEAYEDIKRQKTIYENEILSELQQKIDKAIKYIKEECFSDVYGYTNYGGSLIPKYLVLLLQGGEEDEYRFPTFPIYIFYNSIIGSFKKEIPTPPITKVSAA